MSTNGFFWQIDAGTVAPPKAALTLGIDYKSMVVNDAKVSVDFDAREDFTNPAGNIQGGFLAAMLDDAMGMALSTSLGKGEFAPTLNLNVSFERTAQPGPIRATGCVQKRGKDICFLTGELRQAGQCVATATATVIIRSAARSDAT